jgi:hypothetical protein
MRIFELLSCCVRGRNEIRPLELMITRKYRWLHMSYSLIKEMFVSGLESPTSFARMVKNHHHFKVSQTKGNKGGESRAALHFGGFESKSCIIFGRNCMLGRIEEALNCPNPN